MTAPGMPGPVDRVLGRLHGVHRSGKGWTARCPNHQDRFASLSVAEGDDGRVLLHCHAGCSTDSVVTAMGLAMVDLFPTGSRERLGPRAWKGSIPLGPHGRPALQCMGDDVAAAMLGELGRLAHVRGRLDDKARRCLRYLAGACGSTGAALEEAIAAAVSADEAA